MIIDTHQHLWNLQHLRYSWTVSKPPLNRSFSLIDYWREARELGIEKTIHVEADVDEPFIKDETSYILELASDAESRIGGMVAASRPEKAGFDEYLDSTQGNPKLVGLRRILHTEPDEVSQSPLFRENIRRLAGYGLTFDICVLARQLPTAIELVRSAPDVQFILDHCGNPPISEGGLSQWRADITEISTLPNIACKISGIVTQADHGAWTAEDLLPVVEHVTESFGWDRVMFGSDWPVCTLASSLKRWVKTLELITSNESDQNRRSLFATNAERIYKIPSVAGEIPAS